MGHAKLCGEVVILLASLAWQSYFRYLEFDYRLFDVDYTVGTKSSLLWGHGEDVGTVKSSMPT